MVTVVEKSQWTKGHIAALSDSNLARLNYDQMVEIVLVSGLPMRNIEGIRSLESDALARLVRMALQYCRSQTT